MTPQTLATIRRKTATEVIESVPLGPGVSHRINIAVEVAMNEEWWRGYYAGVGVAGRDPNPPQITAATKT